MWGKSKMKKGCTLADLLIVLAILGCILALILPTLLTKFNGNSNIKVIKMQEKIDYDFTR